MFFRRKEKLNLNSLVTIFESQKKKLLENGYSALLNVSPENFNSSLETLWKSLSEKVNDIEIKIEGNVPLLLVVKQGNLQEKIGKIKGHTELDFNKIKNNQESLNPFYILLDVEDGGKMVAKSTEDSLKRFEKEKRFALNLDESIALLTHYPEILKNHYLISAGTFYNNKENENLPLLWLLDLDDNPELHYAWFDIAHGNYGTGSYAVKIM